jgi:hypothetical protein
MPQTKTHLRTADSLLFNILQKYYLPQICIIFQHTLRTTHRFRARKKFVCIVPTLQICVSAMLLLLIAGI